MPSDSEARAAARGWPVRSSARSPATTYSYTVRDRELTGRELHATSLQRIADPEDRPAALRRTGASRCASSLKENLPGQLSVHGRRVPVPARGGGPDAHVRRRGHARSAPTAASTTSPRVSRRRACRRRSTRSRSTARIRDVRPDIYGKVGNSGRLDRDRRRRQEALLGLRPVRPDDLGVDDHQRAGADHPGVLHERRDRPAGGAASARGGSLGRAQAKARRHALRRAGRGVRAYEGELPAGNDGSGSRCSACLGGHGAEPRGLRAHRGRGAAARCAARCRPTSSRRIRRRTPASSPPSSRCKMMGDVQQYFIDDARPQLLQRLDLRLPHRRGRREPDLAARLHARQRLHDRRVLPRARHGDRRLRAEPQSSSSPTGWTPSMR